MPSIIIARENYQSSEFEVLLQRRSGNVGQAYHWCCPGGSFERIESAVFRNKLLAVEDRLYASRRAALRETIEECGGGSLTSTKCSSFASSFHIDKLYTTGGYSSPSEDYEDCVVPPGLLNMLHQPQCVRPMVDIDNKSSILPSVFLYLIDSDGIDRGWNQYWRPRARSHWRDEVDETYSNPKNSSVVEHGYTWVPLEKIIANPIEPVIGSSMPLVTWDRPWFTTSSSELMTQLDSLRQQLRTSKKAELDAVTSDEQEERIANNVSNTTNSSAADSESGQSSCCE
jgi:hypothetical protein